MTSDGILSFSNVLTTYSYILFLHKGSLREKKHHPYKNRAGTIINSWEVDFSCSIGQIRHSASLTANTRQHILTHYNTCFLQSLACSHFSECSPCISLDDIPFILPLELWVCLTNNLHSILSIQISYVLEHPHSYLEFCSLSSLTESIIGDKIKDNLQNREIHL